VCSDEDTPAPSISSEFIIYSGNTRWRGSSGGGWLWSSETGGTCDSFSLNLNIKGKNSCTASYPLLQLRLCQPKRAIYWTQLCLLPSAVWGCAKLKPTAYLKHLSALHTQLFFFFQCWGLNSGLTPWATTPALFVMGFFQARVTQTICLGWLWTTVLLISASWVARITGVSHWHPAMCWLFPSCPR
jgi:hypothetical protein